MRALLPLAIVVVRALLLAWASTWRLRIHGAGYLRLLRQAGRPVVGCSLHARLLPQCVIWSRPLLRPIRVLISPSSDGEFIRAVVEGLGLRTARGSSGRGGARGFIELVRSLRAERDLPSCMTIDGGGRGPRGVCKPGAARLAARAGAWILPVTCAAAPAAIATRSWDRMVVPWPWARVELWLGRPFRLSGEGEAADAVNAAAIEAAILSLTARADAVVGFRDAQPLRVEPS